jgi:hypothetical protein
MKTYKTSPFPKAAIGATIGTILNLGSTIGSMMPDNKVGNFLQGSIDPLGNLSNATGYLSEGKVGKAFLSMIPGFGNVFAKNEQRKEEEAMRQAAIKEQNDAFFRSKKANDAAVLNELNNDLMAFGGTIQNKLLKRPHLLSYGGSTNNTQIMGNEMPIDPNADMLLNQNGGMTGTHEAGQNIPITDNTGQTQALGEPGEIVVDNPDGSKEVLSKRLGFAQRYEEVAAKIEQLKDSMSRERSDIQRNAMKRELLSLERDRDNIVAEQRAFNVLMGNVVVQNQGNMQAPSMEQSIDPNAMPTDIPMAAGGFGISPGVNLDLTKDNHLLDSANLIPTQQSLVALAKSNPDLYPNGRINRMPTLSTPATPTMEKRNTFTADDIATPKEGFDLDKGLGIASNVLKYAAPVITNALNMKSMRKAAKEINDVKLLPSVVSNYAPKLNINSELAAIDTNYADNLKIGESVVNPMTRAYLANVAGSNRLQARNPLFSQKANFDSISKARMLNTNLGIVNQDINANNQLAVNKAMQRADFELSKINLRNSTLNSMYKAIGEANIAEADRIKIQLAIKQLDRGDGVLDRNALDQVKDMLRNTYGINIPDDE